MNVMELVVALESVKISKKKVKTKLEKYLI